MESALHLIAHPGANALVDHPDHFLKGEANVRCYLILHTDWDKDVVLDHYWARKDWPKRFGLLDQVGLAGLAITAIVYFICALVSPDFEDGHSYDMRAFHESEGPTYIAAFLVMAVFALGINFAAGAGAGVQNWADQNVFILAIIPFLVLALFVKARWVQVLCPIAMAASFLVSLGLYYPVLK